jgi:hypothetical protein
VDDYLQSRATEGKDSAVGKTKRQTFTPGRNSITVCPPQHPPTHVTVTHRKECRQPDTLVWQGWNLLSG